MTAREQLTLARRYLRTEPSLFNPVPKVPAAVWPAAKATMYKRNVHRDYSFGSRGREVIEWQPLRTRVTYGCHCDSCMLTSRHARSGFKRWPCDQPKGARKAKAEYQAHEAQLWDGVRKTVERFTPGAPPTFPHNPELVYPIKPAPKFVHDWINARGPIWKESGPALPGPDVRPHTPAKVRKHFPELDRQPETSKIYTMPKQPKVKRPAGRPPIVPGGMKRVLVTLDSETIAKARKLGGGKLSPGLREVVKRHKAA